MTFERYARSAILLHWSIALLLALEFGLGLRMVSVPQGSATFAAFQLHKSIGITILALSVVRLGVRLARPAPPPVESGKWGGLLARIVHMLFYGVMIGGPLTGWAVVSTSRIAVPTRLFSLVPLPHLPIDRAWNALAESAHEVIAWSGALLFVLHVAGAVRHHVGPRRHDVLGRMMPRVSGYARHGLMSAGIAVALILSVFLAPRLLLSGGSATSVRPGPVSVAARAVTAAPVVEPAAAPTPAPTPSSTPTPAATADTPVAVPWTVLPGGRLGFVATMNGSPIEGSMTRWSADILFDPEATDTSHIVVRIPLLSADTGDVSRDEMLRGDDFFASAGPEAVYRSETIRRTGSGRYRADGSLTMNARTRRVPLDFTLAIEGDVATVAGTARLDRVAFGIGRGQWAATDQIAADVAIAFRLKARRASPKKEEER